MRWLLLASFLVACDVPAPTAAVDALPIVRALPEDVTLVVGVSGERLRAHPRIGDRLRDHDAFGVAGGLRGVDGVVVGCGERGCVALAEGRLDGLTLRRDGQKGADVQRVRAPGGVPTSLVRLGEGKAIAGDRAAVGALRRRWRDRHGLTDGAWLRGLVPEGEAWVAARDPLVFHANAQRWLDRIDVAEARDAARALVALRASFSAAEPYVEAIAVSASVAREQVVVRARARDVAAATWAAGAARARVAVAPLPEHARAARVVQRDREVELQVDVALEPLLETVLGQTP